MAERKWPSLPIPTRGNCAGTSKIGNGLEITLAANCYGQTDGGNLGVNCGFRGVAIGCYGSQRTRNATAVSGHVVIGCGVDAGDNIGFDYFYNQPGPPNF